MVPIRIIFIEPIAMFPDIDALQIIQMPSGEIVGVNYNDYVLPNTTPDDILIFVWDPSTFNDVAMFYFKFDSKPISAIGHNLGGSDSILMVTTDGTKLEIINVRKAITFRLCIM